MTKRKTLYLLIALFLLAAGSAAVRLSHRSPQPSAAPAPESRSAAPAEASSSPASFSSASLSRTGSATLLVGATTYAMPVKAGETIFDAMQQLEKTSAFSFTYRAYPGLGAFVESINGTAGGGGYAWFWYKNGVESPVGISSAVVEPGDKIEWRFEAAANYQ